MEELDSAKASEDTGSRLASLEEGSFKGALEALLLASSEPVSVKDLGKLLGRPADDVSRALSELSAEYESAQRGFRLREVAGGWRFYTSPVYADVVERLVRSWENTRLSPAALETLAVIAYRQPVTREGVKAIRGVASDGVINSLIDKGLVRVGGRDRERGGARLYHTTRGFLEAFGLSSLTELPPLEAFAPDEAARTFIEEKLSSLDDDIEESDEELVEEDREVIHETITEAEATTMDRVRERMDRIRDGGEADG